MAEMKKLSPTSECIEYKINQHFVGMVIIKPGDTADSVEGQIRQRMCLNSSDAVELVGPGDWSRVNNWSEDRAKYMGVQ